MIAGRPAGDLVDRVAACPVVAAGALLCAAMVAGLGLAGNVVVMAALWLAAGAGSAFIWAGLNTLAVQSAPENRGGAISVVGAFKFAGSAVAPLVWLPLYLAHVELAFATAAVACALIALVAVGLRGGPRRSRRQSHGDPRVPVTSRPTARGRLTHCSNGARRSVRDATRA